MFYTPFYKKFKTHVKHFSLLFVYLQQQIYFFHRQKKKFMKLLQQDKSVLEIKTVDLLKQKKPIIEFTAVIIEDEFERKKISDVYDSLKKQGLIPSWFTRPTFKDGTLDYHMTIKLGELPIGFKKDIDKDVTLNIETFGISNNAVALGVSGEYFSDNKYQHITLAFKGFPKYSKNITEWKPLKEPFKVKGIIKEYTSKKEVIKRGVFW